MDYSHFSTDIDLKKLLDNAHIGVVIHNWDTSVLYANPTAIKLLRLSSAQILGKVAYDPQWHFLDESGRILQVSDYPVSRVKQNRDSLVNEVIGVVDSKNESISWFSVNAYAEISDDVTSSFIVITFNDITDKKQAFSFEDVVKNTQDIVIITEAETIDKPFGPQIVYVNKAFEDLTGYTKEEAIGDTPRMLQGELTDKNATDRIKQALEQQQPITETLLNYDKQGRPYWIEMNIVPLYNKYNEVTHFAAIERDVSESKFNVEQLKAKNQELKELKQGLEKRVELRTHELMLAKINFEQLAFFDPLTKVPNRRYFIDQANKVIHFAKRHDLLLAFGFIDVDNFKQTNDTFGHHMGDDVLRLIAKSLAKSFRVEDAFCRYGGEEFAFVVAIQTKNCAEKLVQRLLEEIRACRFVEGEVVISTTISLGVKVVKPNDNTDLEREIDDADEAMFESKKAGKDRYTIID